MNHPDTEQQGAYVFVISHTTDDEEFLNTHLKAVSATGFGSFDINTPSQSTVLIQPNKVSRETIDTVRRQLSARHFRIIHEYQVGETAKTDID